MSPSLIQIMNSKVIDFKDKARGALIGLAIGDSLGDAARKPDIQRDFGFITDFVGEDTWSTDDTEFALLTAKILIDAQGKVTTEDVLKAWKEHVVSEDELKRGGLSEIEACVNIKRGYKPPETGKYNAYYMSDGAAMRSGPIGIMCAGDRDRAMHLAETDACISHYREGIWGAQAVSVAVALAMVDTDIPDIIEEVAQIGEAHSWYREAMGRMRKIIEESRREVAKAWMPLHKELFSTHRSTVAEALPQAFGCLMLKHGSFEEGMILASNFGRDADTIGAVVGCVLGARYGLGGIPESWVKKCRYPSGTCLNFAKGIDVLEYADQLAELIQPK